MGKNSRKSSTNSNVGEKHSSNIHSKLRKTRGKHRQVKKSLKYQILPNEIDKIKKCNTKNSFKQVLISLDPNWKELIKFYLTDCFIFDLYTRKLEDKKHLLSKREIFYSVIENPEVLDLDCHFDNNLVKNFCTGLSNFLKKNYQKMKDMIEKEKAENEEIRLNNHNGLESQHIENHMNGFSDHK